MDTVEVGYVEYMPTAERLSAIGPDFDAEAIDDAVRTILNDRVGPDVTVERNGKVFATESAADRARDIDWSTLLGEIDLEQLVADNPPRR